MNEILTVYILGVTKANWQAKMVSSVYHISRLTVVSRAAKKLQSARPIKRRAATTVSYLRVRPVLQY